MTVWIIEDTRVSGIHRREGRFYSEKEVAFEAFVNMVDEADKAYVIRRLSCIGEAKSFTFGNWFLQQLKL